VIKGNGKGGLLLVGRQWHGVVVSALGSINEVNEREGILERGNHKVRNRRDLLQGMVVAETSPRGYATPLLLIPCLWLFSPVAMVMLAVTYLGHLKHCYVMKTRKGGIGRI